MKGVCGGRCSGTCDGKRANGMMCLGVCVGACDSGAFDGDCKGTCTGSCQLVKPGICDGVCAGKCTVDLTEEKCVGDLKPLDVSSNCRARCDLAVINKTECAIPQVGYVLGNTTATHEADAMKAALDKAFPDLMRILAEVGPQGADRVLTGQKVIDAVRTGFKTTQLKKCFDAPFKKASADAAMAKTGIDQAIGVRDEALRPATP